GRSATGIRARARAAPDGPCTSPEAPADRTRTPAAAADGHRQRYRRNRRRLRPGPPAGLRSQGWSRQSSAARHLPGLGAGGDRHGHDIAPFGPGSVVVAHVVVAEQVRENEPGVAGAFADAAVGDDLIARAQAGLVRIEVLEFGRGLERAVLVGRLAPGH